MSDFLSETYTYRRKLPHIQPANTIYFVTYRLADSLPRSKIIELQIQKEDFELQLKTIKTQSEREKLRQSFHKTYFKKFDDTLDKIISGPTWLNNTDIAFLVTNSLKKYDGIWYNLNAYCVMPNHVHLVFYIGEDHINEFKKMKTGTKNKYYPVTRILESIKKYTARRSNEILNRRGAFWERESYDHIVRNKRSLVRIIRYVLNNPVKAGIVEQPEEWIWNYCKESLRLDL
jgi:putative transposase